jgi:flagellar protein FliO/FliZ
MKPWPSHIVTPVGIRPMDGDTMYKSIAETDLLLTFVVIFVVVLALVGVIARAIRSFATLKTDRSKVWRPRQPRLSVSEHARIDATRCLVLVRRDEVEHLLTIGGEIDIMVEAGVVRTMHKLSSSRSSTVEILDGATFEADGDDWPLQPFARPQGVRPADTWLG